MNQNGGTRSLSQQDAGPSGRLEKDNDFIATAWKDGKVTLPNDCENCHARPSKEKLFQNYDVPW